jgi:Lrp/AsnC family transcriptional regulator, leucine-responsive regulatory protein
MFAQQPTELLQMRLSTDLDQTDLEILRTLQGDGRIHLGALAERVGLSSPAVAERVRKLEERGVIMGFTTRLDPRHLALDISAFILVRVDSSTRYPKFLEKAQGHPEIMECHAITGEASHLLKIRTRNTATLESFLAEIQRWPGVIGTRTSLVLSTHKESLELPLSHAEEIVAESRPSRARNSESTPRNAERVREKVIVSREKDSI